MVHSPKSMVYSLIPKVYSLMSISTGLKSNKAEMIGSLAVELGLKKRSP